MSDNPYNPPPTTDVVGFARYLSRRWEKAFEDRRRESGPATSNYASSIGGPCLRQSYYQRIGAPREPFSARTLAIFESGNMIERNTADFMRAEMEIDWIRSQESAPKTELNIGCRIDGGIRGLHQHDQPYLIAEVKRCNQHEWNKITDCDVQGIHDMLNKCSFWIAKYCFQGSAYLHLYDEAGVIFILREPSSGWVKFVPLVRDSPIDLKLWAEIQSRAKAINAAVESGEVPERITWSRQICQMCNYSDTICFPEKVNIGAELLSHPDLVKAAKEMLATEAVAKRAKELKAYLREVVLQTQMDHVVIGDSLEAKVSDNGTVRFTEIKGNLFFGGDDG